MVLMVVILDPYLGMNIEKKLEMDITTPRMKIIFFIYTSLPLFLPFLLLFLCQYTVGNGLLYIMYIIYIKYTASFLYR